MPSRLATIRAALRRADIENLLALGAPSDEYDCEAEMIWQQLSACRPAQRADPKNLSAIIRRVWQEMFELDETELAKRMGSFTSLANDILAK